jgi:hypothetical protein
MSQRNACIMCSHVRGGGSVAPTKMQLFQESLSFLDAENLVKHLNKPGVRESTVFAALKVKSCNGRQSTTLVMITGVEI